MTDIHAERIIILDFGSQYTQLIARRVRELGVYCEIHPHTLSDAALKALRPAGIILSGGPESVTDLHTPRAPDSVFTLGCPVLGICYGMQTMAVQLGGQVVAGAKREFGYASVRLADTSPLLHQLAANDALDVWMSHGDQVQAVPNGFHIIADTDNCAVAAMADVSRHFYGLQFHPEVSHTTHGLTILERFLKDCCRVKPSWTISNIIEEQIADIKKRVGADRVILGLSGGVDSSVAAVLLQRAIPEQLTCVFVDTGLLRLGEVDQVKQLFVEHFGMNLICVNAAETFLTALAGESDPEKKRKIIGKTFIDVFDNEAKKIPGVKWLAQGTIYSDVIESAKASSGAAHVIKSHHNVGGLPEDMALNVLEPLRELFKDEVRKMGLELGLPHALLYRHPFPGPGLGVRVLGEIQPAYVEKLRLADAILIEELHRHALYDKVSQAFAVYLPVKSVGVVGDARQYEHVIALRVVETIDFMTAEWARLPYDFLAHVASRIINEVKGISRVTYDISSKPPATIEWE